MNWEEILRLVTLVLSGMATALPLVVKLVQYVQTAAKEKNWTRLLKLVLQLMSKAEELYAEGAERKAYVLSSVEELSGALDYDVDEKTLSELIDALCAMSKNVNGR